MIGWVILILILAGIGVSAFGFILGLMPIVDNSPAFFMIVGATMCGAGLLMLIGAGIYNLM